jgi:transposase InsO family protein/DNA-binding transcriptional ArsR family regulator
MASKVIAMKLISAVIAVAEGRPVNVTQLCRDVGVSRPTFYRLLDRYREEGLAGIEPRSRRPHTSPNQTSLDVEEMIVRIRKQLDEDGLDHGAITIWWHLKDCELSGPVPSPATIHRILVRRGQVEPAPKKRPKSSFIRFEAPAPNDLWQIDAMDWKIVTGVVKVFNIVDDHSRLAARSRAVERATTEQAWTTFCQASQRWGLPARMLSDNGLCFSGRLRGFEVMFEAKLRETGITPVTGRPYHPQTTGKVERFQQTLKKWLTKQPIANDLAELQHQLDEFCHIYNTQRRHQGISGQIPIERFNASTPSGPATKPLPHPTWPGQPRPVTVNKTGNIRIGSYIINIGIKWAHNDALVLIDNNHASVFIADHLVRHLELDTSRRYQPSGNRRGGPRHPRLQS